MFQPLARLLAAEFSGHRARNYAIEIHRTDRFSSFALYQETAAYCAQQMTALGLQAVERIPARADGRTAYGDWCIPRAWDPGEAVLRIEGSDEPLARYPDEPCALFLYSASTPREGIATEIVAVDDLGRIPDDFRGQLVFFSGTVGKEERKLLARRGIVGIVSERGKLGFPDWRGWDNYTLAPRNDEALFGFSLSARAAARLRAACRHGRAAVFARVDARLYDGQVDTITGTIPGEFPEQQEVLALAHLYEQGANDNASGVGACLEAFRVLQTLIARGALPRPRRTLRLLLGFECCGFLSYVVAHRERMERTVAAINPDMVGEDQEACGSSFALHLTPSAAPSCIDALAVRLFDVLAAGRDPLFRWRTAPYTICDSFVADPTIGVPSVSIIGLPDRFYHSSMDTPDRLSPESLARTGLVLTTFLAFLAAAEAPEARWLAEAAGAYGRAEIGRVAVAARADDPEVAPRLAFLAARHSQAVASARRFADTPEVRETVEFWQRELERDLGRSGARAPSPIVPGPDPVVPAAASLVPTRQVVGPLTLEPLLLRHGGPLRWSAGWSAPYNDHLIWADGVRSVQEIWQCARQDAACYDPESVGPPLTEILDYFVFLAEHGYVRLEPRPHAT